MYVGVVVFGLIASLSVLAYTVLILVGYQPPAESPYELLFPEPEETVPGQTLFLSLAVLFTVGFTAVAWRALLRGAREDLAIQRNRRELEAELRRRKHDEDGPPGYH